MSTRTDEPNRGIEEAADETIGDDRSPVIPDEPASPTGRHQLGAFADRLAPGWRDRRIAAASALGAGALWGAVAGWWTPRGPLTTSQALWSIAISLVVGTTAGVATRSRWAMLATPAAFAGVFELVRIGTDGPTVDGISTSTYGLIALVVGRGFHVEAGSLIAAAPAAHRSRRTDPARIASSSTGGATLVAARRRVA